MTRFQKFADKGRKEEVQLDANARVIEVQLGKVLANEFGLALIGRHGVEKAIELVRKANDESEDWQHNDSPTMRRLYSDVGASRKFILDLTSHARKAAIEKHTHQTS